MGEFRLSRQPSSAFLARFDPAKIKIHGDDAVAEIVFGRHQFEVGFPTDGLEVRPELFVVARDVLAQIAELDAVAMREVDGTEGDGELFVVEIRSENEVDLRYSAVSWNSDWCEMFRRGSDGRWVHHGVRKHI